MYARVSAAEVQPGRTDEVVAISKDSVLPAARQQQGFEGGLWLTDPDANKVVVVTLWGSREDMESGETSGYYREQIGKLGGMLAGDVVREAQRSASEDRVESRLPPATAATSFARSAAVRSPGPPRWPRPGFSARTGS
jgi:heme-degrading monooxygenase HmoA